MPISKNESEFQTSLATMLRKKGWLVTKMTASLNGWPDLLLLHEDIPGHTIYVELKIGGNSLSPAQKQMIAQIKATGNIVIVCRKLESTTMEKVFTKLISDISKQIKLKQT